MCIAGGQDNHTTNSEKKTHTKPKIINAFRPAFVEIISLPSKGVIRGVFSANHLASNDNLISNNQETVHKQTNVWAQKSRLLLLPDRKNVRQHL